MTTAAWIIVGFTVWAVLVVVCVQFFHGASVQQHTIDRLPL